MGRRFLAAGVVGLFAVGLAGAGCHSTTVQVVAEAGGEPPPLYFDITNAQAGHVQITNSERKDCILGTRHKLTEIRVPPGSRIVIMAASLPARPEPPQPACDENDCEPATEPAETCPDSNDPQ